MNTLPSSIFTAVPQVLLEKVLPLRSNSFQSLEPCPCHMPTPCSIYLQWSSLARHTPCLFLHPHAIAKTQKSMIPCSCLRGIHTKHKVIQMEVVTLKLPFSDLSVVSVTVEAGARMVKKQEARSKRAEQRISSYRRVSKCNRILSYGLKTADERMSS